MEKLQKTAKKKKKQSELRVTDQTNKLAHECKTKRHKLAKTNKVIHKRFISKVITGSAKI